MKLINKIFLGLLFVCAFESFAQQRNVDLKIKVTSHKDKDYIKSNGTITIKYSVFNKGPDKILINDSLYIYGSYYDSSFKPYPYIIPIPQDIAVNDSIVMTFTNPYSFTTDFNHFFISITVQPLNRSKNGTILESLEQQKDNRSIISDLKYRSPTSGVDKIKKLENQNIYPNPANEIVNLQFDNKLEISKITIFNINGNLVKEFQFSDFIDFKTISTVDLPNGIYYISVINKVCSICSKLTILH